MSDNSKNDNATDKSKAKQPASSRDSGKEKKAAHKASTKPATSKTNLLLVFIVIVLVLAIIGGGYEAWQFYTRQQSRYTHNINQLDSRIEQLTKAQRYQSEQQQLQLDALVNQQIAMRENFSNLLKDKQHLRNDWLFAEAEYLVKLANHRLILEKDINTAIVALQAADARLREMADPGTIEIRKTLVEQIHALNAIQQPDITGISLQLGALEKEVDQLPMQTPDPATVAQRTKQPSQASQVKSWRDLPAAIWHDLKSLLVIRDHSQPVHPLMPPEQRYFLIQNLKLQLQQGRLALLKGNNELYKDNLVNAQNWIEKHFDNSSQACKSMLSALGTLSAINISPALPDISNTYSVMQQYRLNGTKSSKQQNKTANTSETKPGTEKQTEPQTKQDDKSKP